MTEQNKPQEVQPSKTSLEKAKSAHDYAMNLMGMSLQQIWQIGYTSGFQDAMEIVKTDQGQPNGN